MNGIEDEFGINFGQEYDLQSWIDAGWLSNASEFQKDLCGEIMAAQLNEKQSQVNAAYSERVSDLTARLAAARDKYTEAYQAAINGCLNEAGRTVDWATKTLLTGYATGLAMDGIGSLNAILGASLDAADMADNADGILGFLKENKEAMQGIQGLIDAKNAAQDEVYALLQEKWKLQQEIDSAM